VLAAVSEDNIILHSFVLTQYTGLWRISWKHHRCS